MSELSSTKPYFLRAIHEWCVDNGLTPHLAVSVGPQVRVPPAYVKDGEIVLNINYSATKDLRIDNDAVSFSARFGGAAFDIYVPIDNVRGIFARENGQGMFFDLVQAEGGAHDAASAEAAPEDLPEPPRPGKPSLKLVK